MEDNRQEKAKEVVNEIVEQYNARRGTQPEIAANVNEKFNTNLTQNDVAEITRQEGNYHTIKRKQEKTVVYSISETLKNIPQKTLRSNTFCNKNLLSGDDLNGSETCGVYVQSVRQEGNEVRFAGEAYAGKMPSEHWRRKATPLDGESEAGKLKRQNSDGFRE